jgi:lipoprotein-anchoring transpeptidase ErfK/SrfK
LDGVLGWGGVYKAATFAAMLIVLEGPGGHASAQYYFPGAYPPAQVPPLNQPVPLDPDNEFYDMATMPRGAIASTRGDPRNVAALPPEVRPETGPKKELPPQFRRTLVDYYTKEPEGTVIVDTPNTYLYLVLGQGKALRYGIGVGREGFTWSGAERISRKVEWPDWNPPEQMIERQPYLPRFMAGGDGNPLGARALYLGETIYRIGKPCCDIGRFQRNRLRGEASKPAINCRSGVEEAQAAGDRREAATG